MRLIIAGPRTFRDTQQFARGFINFLNVFKLKTEDVTEIVSGGADGADSMGEGFAAMAKVPVKRFLPNWSTGRHAGFIRNEEMAVYGTHLLLFWDGESKGSKNMLDNAKKHGLKVYVYRYDNPELSEIIDPAPLLSV